MRISTFSRNGNRQVCSIKYSEIIFNEISAFCKNDGGTARSRTDWSQEPPPPRGGFLFTRFPNQLTEKPEEEDPPQRIRTRCLAFFVRSLTRFYSFSSMCLASLASVKQWSEKVHLNSVYFRSRSASCFAITFQVFRNQFLHTLWRLTLI